MSQSRIWRRLNNLVPNPKCETRDSGDLDIDYEWLKGIDSNGTPRWHDERPMPTLRQIKLAPTTLDETPEEKEIEGLKTKMKNLRDLTPRERRLLFRHLARKL
jgi:hypothetical protein